MAETSFVLCIVGIAVIVAAARQAKIYFTETTDPSHQSRRRARVTNDMIEVVQSVVPWVSREAIEQDLQVTHNIEETTMRFVNMSAEQDNIRRVQKTVADGKRPAASGELNNSELRVPESAEDIVLKRFGVHVSDHGEKDSTASHGRSADRESREDWLNSRRREMVLRARNKMLAKKAAKAA